MAYANNTRITRKVKKIMNNTSLFSRIKAERKRLKLTQKRMAELGGVGLRAQQHYEKGTNKPGIEYLESLDNSDEIDFDSSYILTGERKPDPELVGLPAVQKGVEVSIRVIEAVHDLGMTLERDATKEVCMYAFQHCPTEQGIKEYIKSVYAIKGVDIQQQQMDEQLEFLKNITPEPKNKEEDDFNPLDCLYLGGDKGD